MQLREIVDNVIILVKTLLEEKGASGDIEANTDLYNIGSFSSIEYIHLIVLIEGKFNIEIDDGQLLFKSDITPESIANSIFEKIQFN